VPSRTIALPLLLAALLVTSACSKPKDAASPAAPAATTPAPLYSYAQTNDLRIAPQLVKGWYGVEDGAWRWMAKESQASLKNPGVFPAGFEVRLTLPKPIADAVGMPVTFTVLLDGKVLGEEVYQQDGAFIFEKTVQPGMLSPGPVAVTLRVNKAKPPVPGGDARELGAVIAGFGFK
jgi:hypothetical protein